MTLSLLPTISDSKQYKKLFPKNECWDSAIEYLRKKYNLGGSIQRGALGSHIVYRAGDFWIKLMAPIFRKDMPFELSGLKAVQGNLSVATPRVVAEGEIEGWAYVIVSHLEGEAIRDVWPLLSREEKAQLADQMAQILSELRLCKSDSVIKNRFQWNSFINAQYENCEARQKQKGLAGKWLQEVSKFLGSFDISEFESEDPVFLHADLTFDHFLVTRSPQTRISGIIDFADCQVGHFEYELIAPCTFIFKEQRELLVRFLAGCGFQTSQLNKKFSEKLLAWALLHRYFDMAGFFKDEMSSCEPGDFQALAQKIYPLV